MRTTLSSGPEKTNPAVGFSCKCRPGYRLGDDGSCVENDEEFLMVIKDKQIIDLSLTSEDKSRGHFTPVVDVKFGLSLDYDMQEQTIYWTETEKSDQRNATLYKSNMGGGEKIDFFAEFDASIVGSPYCIAFDWIARNMYIGNIEAAEISLVQVDGTKFRYRMLVLGNNGQATGVGQPVSMVVLPSQGKLFWLDRGGAGGVPPKLASANMDGSKPSILVNLTKKAEFLTIDLQKEVLYFSTSDYPAMIRSINLDGSNMRTILTAENGRAVAQPTGIAVMDRRLYYLDPKFEKVIRVDSDYGENEQVLMDNESGLRTLNIYRKRRGQNSHPCSSNRGGCEQICIPDGRNQRVCGCSVGYKKDGETQCVAYDSFAMVSQLKKARGFDLNGPEDRSNVKEAMVPIAGPGHNILHMDFIIGDKNKNEDDWIYWVDFEVDDGGFNGIYRVKPDGSERTQIIKDGIGKSGIRGIAVDWIAKNLYFSNVFPHETYVEVSWLDGTNRKVIYKSTTDAPREIAVNPVKRYLYWLDYGQFPMIARTWLDGSNRTALVTTAISNPRDLTIDMQTHDVYWVDSQQDAIFKVSWNGKDRQMIRSNLPSPKGLAIFRDMVYWVDRNLAMIQKASKFPQQVAKAEPVRTGMQDLRDIVFFDGENQPFPKDNPCQRLGNGQCEQLCFSYPKDSDISGRKCSCATGSLSNDGRSCRTSEDYLVFATQIRNSQRTHSGQ